MTVLRAPSGFEKDVLRQRSVLIGAALAAIAAGVVAFIIGLRQPVEMQVGMVDAASFSQR